VFRQNRSRGTCRAAARSVDRSPIPGQLGWPKAKARSACPPRHDGRAALFAPPVEEVARLTWPVRPPYARVSTQDQRLTGQLTVAGATTIFRDSGARADRPQVAKLMASLKEGDVVLVTKLDRLGRSTRELLNLIERIGKAGAAFRSLGDPLWDTSSSQGRLLSTLLAAIAEFERDLIKERTGEGRKRAMANGVKFGRRPKLSTYNARKPWPRGWRDPCRDRQILRRGRLDDFAVALIAPHKRCRRRRVLGGHRSFLQRQPQHPRSPFPWNFFRWFWFSEYGGLP
jgi:DNA invertase Pin-like site-specific DNA recombinase